MTTATLRDGIDYIPTGNPVTISTTLGPRMTNKVIEVFTAADNAIRYKCHQCDYLAERPSQVIPHIGKHTRAVKNAVAVEVARKAAAFDMLPEQMQKSLMRRLATSAGV
jgi:hypothetical protein